VFIFRRIHAYLYVLNKHLTLYCTSTPKLHARSFKTTARSLLGGQRELVLSETLSIVYKKNWDSLKMAL